MAIGSNIRAIFKLLQFNITDMDVSYNFLQYFLKEYLNWQGLRDPFLP